MIITDDEANLIIGALNSLGVALTDHHHQWTDGERAIYEEAVKTLCLHSPETKKQLTY